jgi:DNA integrity scanning protein DisA with diadenylate cyclase activity
MKALIESCKKVIDEYTPTFLLIITNDEKTQRSITKELPNLPLITATNDSVLYAKLIDKGADVRELPEAPLGGMTILDQAEDLLLNAYVEGLVDIDDKVLCLISTSLQAMIFLNVENIGILHLKKQLEDRIDLRLLEVLLNLSFDISREGREGRIFGSLFVIGDTKNVMKLSRPLIINPFKGHTKKERDIMNKDNWETIKEFAQLDGAIIVDDKGKVEAAGRYISVSWDIYLQSGLGGRHLAGASISKTTKAVAVTVSSSGVVRIFKDGNEIFKVKTV